MRTWILIILLLTLPLTLGAVGKVTVDPNVPGANQESQETEIKDVRLAQKITYTASARTVSAILADLTTATGITFRAGINRLDWQVQDRKMTISVTDVPVSHLMNSIARVMKFKWQRSGEEGKWIYRLSSDTKALLAAENKRDREKEQVEAEKAKRRAEGIEQYSSLMDLSKESLQELRQTNPYLSWVAESELGKSLGKFFKESPDAIAAIAGGQRMDLKASDMSVGAQNSLISAVREMSIIEQRIRGVSAMREISPAEQERMESDIFKRLDHIDPSKLTLSFSESPWNMLGVSISDQLIGNLSVKYGADETSNWSRGETNIPLFDPQSPMANCIGKIMLDSEEQKQPMSKIVGSHFSELINAIKVEREAVAEQGEPIIEHDDDEEPALQEKITFEVKSRKLYDIQLEFAKASKLNVVSDYFGAMNPTLPVTTGKVELRDLLKSIQNVYFYNWDKQGDIIEFRDRNWLEKRACQLPEASVEVWRKELSKTDTIGLDGLSQIAQLTQEQYIQNVMSDDELSPPTVNVRQFGNQDILKVYASLDASQRRAMTSSEGLDLATLTEEQYAPVEKLLKSRLRPQYTESANVVTIACKKEIVDQTEYSENIVYTFRVDADGKPVGPEWVMYVPVKKKPADKN